MVFFNYALRKLNAKIVYYGPGLCGKTTNLQWIHDHFEGGQRGKMISLSTEGDRTIFFDLLPLDIGSIRGMDVTLQLYTVPGQVHYNSTRQLVLRGADGVVFVADSQTTMRTSNVDSLRNLGENLSLQGVELDGFPHVLQFNKRDLGDLISIEDLDSDLNHHSVPFFESSAVEGVGVQETLEGIVKLVMRSLRERYEPVPPAGPTPPDEKPIPLDVEVPPAAPFAVVPPVVDVPPAVTPPAVMEPAAERSGIQDDVPTEVYESGRPPEEPEDEGALPGSAFWDAAEEASGPTFEGGESGFPDDEPTGSKNFGFAMPFADNETTTDVTDLGENVDEITAERLSEPVHDIEPDDETPVDATASPFEVADLTPEPFSAGSVFGATEDDVDSETSMTDESSEVDGLEVEEGGDETTEEEISIGDIDEEDAHVIDEPAMAAGTVDDLVASVLAETPDEPDRAADVDDGGYGDETEPHTEIHTDDEGVDGQSVGESPFDETHSEATESVLDDDETAGEIPTAETVEEDPEDAEVAVSEHYGEFETDLAVEEPAEDEEGEEWPAEDRDTVEEPEVVSVGDDVSEEEGETPTDETPDGGLPGDGPEVEFEPPSVADRELDFAPVDDFVPSEAEDEIKAEVGQWDEAHTDEFLLGGSAEAAVEESAEVEPGEQIDIEEDREEVIEIEPEFEVDDDRIEDEIAFDEDPQKHTDHSPVIFGEGDPFGDETDDMATPVRSEVQPHVEISTTVDDGATLVRAEDNQLHLRLHGTGAIAESGQVRALDIEVPVPGSWVGNRRVTLQLRLTLTPMSEDDDGGPGDAS